MNSNYRVVTLKEYPKLTEEIDKLHRLGWVKFMGKDPIANKYWNKLQLWFAEFQFLLLDNKGTPIACGHSIPFHWNGTENNLPPGWDGVFEQGILEYENNIKPNSVSALAIVIHPEFQGKGLSELMIKEMKSLVKSNQIHQMVAPVRPSLKHRYPLIPMSEYIRWKRKDGKPFDPWIRTHCKTGATIIKVAEKSMVIPATIQEWEEWTDMEFHSSGKYVIPGGLVPLNINRDANTGVYIEPNVWLNHQLD
ncbi:GNAT family N-acetyltransferase [Priestia aryabhattai]|uniref:GNAT family N-acetyltransferase n=1 Tax=Priestia aryabhattai TaxID=412384 RepID=UPI003D2CAAD0